MLAASSLYAILDLPHARGVDPLVAARALIAGGAKTLQLRAKGGWPAALLDPTTVAALMAAAAEAGVALVLNDDVERARAWAAHARRPDALRMGVHLGQSDLPDRPPATLRRELSAAGLALGVSTHDLEQVAAARAYSPDYIGFGPVYATSTKADAEAVVGLERLAQAVEASCCPVVAIGGMTPARARACFAVGAAAVASISALVAATPEQIQQRAGAFASSSSASENGV